MRCLRNYEKGYNGHLQDPTASQELHSALLDATPNNAAKFSKARFRRPFVPEGVGASISGAKPRDLPTKFLLQLDNCSGQNKNRWMFSFLSYLTAVGIFERVNLGFLMPGHTHEDVDALFGKYSHILNNQTTTNFPKLLEIFQRCTNPSPIGSLIEEVPDWKSFVEGYTLDMEGHSRPLQYTFWVRDGIPIFQWKMRPSEDKWRGGQEIWRRDANNKPMIPPGQPKALKPFNEVKQAGLTKDGINDYIKHWQTNPDETNRALIDYWKNVSNLLDEIDTTSTELKEGWLPKSRWRTLADAEEDYGTVNAIVKAYAPPPSDKHYVGPKKDRPKYLGLENYEPSTDVECHQFVVVKPADRETYPVWLGYTISDICKEEGNINLDKVRVEWWCPVHQLTNVTDKERYLDCWTKRWRRNPSDPDEWLDIETVLYSWTPKNVPGRNVRVTIPMDVKKKAKEALGEP
jgi:hypothetical protein